MDFLPFFIYWKLGGDISSFFEVCSYRIADEYGFCISAWHCTEMVEGFIIGSCGTENRVCCRFPNTENLNWDSMHSAFLVHSKSRNGAEQKMVISNDGDKMMNNFPFGTNSLSKTEINVPVKPDTTTDTFLNTWKILAPPVVYQKPIEISKDHNLRQPVGLSTDFNLRYPVMLEDAHDLRWPVLEEDSHDERNPVSLHFTVTSGQLSDDIVFYHKCEDTFSEFYRNTSGTKESTKLEHMEVIRKNMEMLDAALNVCGISVNKITAKLVGGRDSTYLQWPWMVSLRERLHRTFEHVCGAALLNNQWVITAAHCVQKSLIQNISLRIGSYYLKNNTEYYQYVDQTVSRIIMHPEYNSFSYENDIALLLLSSPVEFKPNIIPICLPKNVNNVEGRTAVVLGWGVTNKGSLSDTLQELYLPVLTNRECERMYSKIGPREQILDMFICAGTAEGGSDACERDSGGPLAIKDSEGRWSLIGIVSWGKVCAAPNQPGVYTRIEVFMEWIEGTMACHSE